MDGLIALIQVGPSESGELVSINPSVVLLSVAARNSARQTFTSASVVRPSHSRDGDEDALAAAAVSPC